MSTQDHREKAANHRARCAVLTVSDTRTVENDQGGRTIIDTLTAAGHSVVTYAIVRDEPGSIRDQLRNWLELGELDLIVTTGGTGIASRDTTIEVARKLITRELEGFGELFRMLSFKEVGPAAMLSRAVAGLAGEVLLFALPGSPSAVALALHQLIVPELPHLIWERRR